MMNAAALAESGYGTSRQPIQTHRSLEYDAFLKVTQDLNRTAKNRRNAFASFAEALHRNRRLWTILAGDVAEPTNALPQALRAQIFYLAEFTDQHTTKVLSNQDTIEPLIDINKAIMAGLRTAAGDF